MATNWPTVRREERRWSDGSRYLASTVAPIDRSTAHTGVSIEALLDAADAERAIVAFDADWGRRFGGMELGAIQGVLLRSEASSSSQIEHLTVGAAQLSVAILGASRKLNANLVADNVAAMRTVADFAEHLDLATLERLHSALMAHSDLSPGLRRELVWIGTSSLSPAGADHVGVEPDEVEPLVEDLLSFAKESTPSPLAQAALAHAQFETIHPFADGNGRVGRALIHAIVQRTGLVQHLTVPLSAGLLADTDRYLDALRRFQSGELDPIVRCLAEAARRGADQGRRLLEELANVQTRLHDQYRGRSGSTAVRLLDTLLGQPAVDVRYVASTLDVSDEAARTAIRALEDAGVLSKISTGSRNRVWVARAVTDAFDRVATAAPRRREW